MAAISPASMSSISSPKRVLSSSMGWPACRSRMICLRASRRAGSMPPAAALSAMPGRSPVLLSISAARSFISWLSGTLPCSATVSSVAMRPTVRRSTGLVSFLNSGW